MAYNTKTVIRDVQNVPIPQYFNQASDTYEAIQGTNGAMRVANYDSAGNEVLTAANPGKITVQTALPAGDNIVGRVKITDGTDVLDVASDGSLTVDVKDRSARILGKITADDGAIAQIGDLAASAITDPTQSASVIALLKGLIKQLQGTGTGKTPVINQNAAGNEIFTSSNPGSVDVTDRADRVLGKITADDGAITTAGAKADAAVTDPTASASMIALLKGLIKQLQGNGIGRAPVVNQNSSGTEIFTTSNPAQVVTGALITAPVTRIVTATETPVSLNSKSNLRQIVVRNTNPYIRVRVGETGMTSANNKGFAIEPGAVYSESFDPATAVTIYCRSEGAAVEVEVYEV